MIPNCQRWFLPPSGGGVSPSPLIEDWYDSLSVKPSDEVLTDLNILVDGMDEDGDWEEIDLFGMVAALETDEQRLMPLKTTSGDSAVAVGTPTLSTNGIDGTVGTGLNLKWNPVDDGVKYQLTDCYVGVFGITKVSTVSIRKIIGSYYNDGIDPDKISKIAIQTATTALRVYFESYINSSQRLSNTSKTLLNAVKTFFLGISRDSSDMFVKVNTTSVTDSISETQLPNVDFGLMGVYEQTEPGSPIFSSEGADSIYVRGYIAGSSLIDHNRVATRLNTFFTSRGLSIDNY